MKTYNLIEMLVTLGYKVIGAKSTITRRKKKLEIEIDDYERVTYEEVKAIIDSLKKEGTWTLRDNLDRYQSDVLEETESEVSRNNFV